MFCNKCGTQLPEGSVFCNICGYKLGETITTPVNNAGIPMNSVATSRGKSKLSFIAKLIVLIVSGIHLISQFLPTFTSSSYEISYYGYSRTFTYDHYEIFQDYGIIAYFAIACIVAFIIFMNRKRLVANIAYGLSILLNIVYIVLFSNDLPSSSGSYVVTMDFGYYFLISTVVLMLNAFIFKIIVDCLIPENK